MLPIVKLKAGEAKSIRQGYPWGFSNQVHMSSEAKAIEPGSLVIVADAGFEILGIAGFNPHSLISLRFISRGKELEVDFFKNRLARALNLRDSLYSRPFYRLIHSEADGLPGLVIDRYGQAVVIQLNTALAENLKDQLIAALEELINPEIIILRRDTQSREHEGLKVQEPEVIKGTPSALWEIEENGLTFYADLLSGQKTGWFFDQRNNRSLVASLAKGRKVADFYCHTGAFALNAAKAGALEVVAVDASAHALELAAKAASINGLNAQFTKADVFDAATGFQNIGRKFDLVIADPPAFIKSKKDMAAGLKGYRKLTRLVADLVEPGGFLFIASCSHHASLANFSEEVIKGLGPRQGRILQQVGAGFDHPTHPHLPESAYLKGLLLQLD